MQTIGGVAVGTAGTGIRSGYKLAGGEDFNALDIYAPANPGGKHIASHRRRGRRSVNSGANDYYWSPEHTGYRDVNRGVKIGSGVSDLLSVSSSVVSLATRLSTAAEKAAAWVTTATTGPQRPQSSASIHSAGYQAVKYPFVIDWRARIPAAAGLHSGAWPALWMEDVLPTWANTGEFDFEWIDNATLRNNFITGTSVNDAISSTVTDTSDGNFHKYSMIVTAATIKFYKDDVLLITATGRPDSAVTGPMFWWLRIGVDLTPSIYQSMNYNTAAWAGVTSTMDVDYVQLWTTPSATDLPNKGTVATINVDFAGTIAATLPSKATLWGAAAGSVTEELIFQPVESAEPGITQVPATGAPNTWYGSATKNNGQWGPSFLTWNPATRALTGSGFDEPGQLVGHLVAWDDTNGGLAGFARVVINVGPTMSVNTIAPIGGTAFSFDLYANCLAGMLTTNSSGVKAKTISVTGLGASGLSYDDNTGLLTGSNPVAGTYSLNVTITNSLGQTVTQTLTATISAATGYAYQSWTGSGWFDASDSSSITVNGSSQVTTIKNKRASGGDLTMAGTITDRTYVANVQNSKAAVRIVRDVSTNTAVPRGEALIADTISVAGRGSQTAFTAIAVYIPRDTNTGYIWSWSRTIDTTHREAMTLVSRNASACTIRKDTSTQALGANDVTFGAGQAVGSPCIVAVRHTGTAVSVWDTSLTKSLNAAAQATAVALGSNIKFRLFAAESASASAPPVIETNSRSIDFLEAVIDGLQTDADIQQAISDLATKWGITLV